MSLQRFPRQINGGLGRLGRSAGVAVAVDELTLTGTVTAGQTLTLQRMTVSESSVVHWGDGSTTNLTANSTAAVSKVYAAGGVYEIRVEKASKITQIDLRDTKISLFDTAQLKSSLITYITAFGALQNFTIKSSDMVNWPMSIYQITSMPFGGIYELDSADMVNWNPTTFLAQAMPAGSYSIRTSDFAAWNPVFFGYFAMPPGSLIISSASDFAGWVRATTIRTDNMALLQPAVNRILEGVYSMFPARIATGGEIRVGGTNAAPSGVFQAACPPTTGLEWRYELLNDSCGVNPTKKWTSIDVAV